MAAGTLPEPGTEYGPCAEPCKHTDCAATRRTAESACRYCGDPIGYERRYYLALGANAQTGPWEHASCVEAGL